MHSLFENPEFDSQLKALRLRAEGHYSFEQKIDGFKRHWLDVLSQVRVFLREKEKLQNFFRGNGLEFALETQIDPLDLEDSVKMEINDAWVELQAELDKWEKIWAEKKGSHGHAPNPQEKLNV